jgi:hypothetical protein
MKRLLVISIVTGLTGCVSRMWCNPDAPTSQGLAQAQYACKDNGPGNASDLTVNTDPHALRAISGGGLGTSIGQDPFEFTECMEKRGYRYVDKRQCDPSAPGK